MNISRRGIFRLAGFGLAAMQCYGPGSVHPIVDLTTGSSVGTTLVLPPAHVAEGTVIAIRNLGREPLFVREGVSVMIRPEVDIPAESTVFARGVDGWRRA